jgi:hypothetical protein
VMRMCALFTTVFPRRMTLASLATEWRFKRFGGSKFSLQSVALGKYLEVTDSASASASVAGGAAAGAPAAALHLVDVFGSPRVDPGQKWRIHEASVPHKTAKS